jgi:AcrR family transcriptional regulator
MSTIKRMNQKQGSARQVAMRFGRPPKRLAGEVDARVIDAARKIFLERAFEGASIGDISQAARSGKRTIYARFRNKRELFTAVVTHDSTSRISQFASEAPIGPTIEERLTGAGILMLRSALEDERIALMRLAIAEMQRFSDLSSTISRTPISSLSTSRHGCLATLRRETNSRRCRP